MSLTPAPTRAIEVFYSYAHEDERLQKRLEKQLSLLKRQGQITNWHNREITAGMEWTREIDKHLNAAQIILLLVSPDYISSDYCYSVEMGRAIERHKRGEAHLIPVLLRPAHWKGAPFGELKALPTNNRPVTRWSNLDEAFLDVARGIQKAVNSFDRKLCSDFRDY